MFKLFSSSLIRNINKKKNPPIYQIQTVDSLESNLLDSSINRLKSRKIDGFIIKNVFDEKTIEVLKDYFSKIRSSDEVDQVSIDTYPLSFVSCMFADAYPENYFEKNKEVNSMLLKKTGIDLSQKFIDIISRLNDGKEVKVKSGPNDDGTFIPFQFRSLNNQKTNIDVHCENGLIQWNPRLNDELGEEKVQLNPIPFFITLQKSEDSSLSLFDLKWRENQTIEYSKDNGVLIRDKNGKVHDCSEKGIKRLKINTDVGDMIIFNGGFIWHKVEDISPDSERITLGAFLNITKDNKVEIWS